MWQSTASGNGAPAASETRGARAADGDAYILAVIAAYLISYDYAEYINLMNIYILVWTPYVQYREEFTSIYELSRWIGERTEPLLR